MKKVFTFSFLLIFTLGFSQEIGKLNLKINDSLKSYKKRVLETAEIDILTSFYTQDGDNAAVTGGIGSEDLQDIAMDINVAIPINDDDILNIDATVSAYTSASSSNLNPFSSGASSGGGGDDDRVMPSVPIVVTGSPWVASSGASKSDVWASGTFGYSHSSDNRNNTYNAHLSFATEFDYTSFGFGGGYAHLFNEKNTEISVGLNMYLDTWNPVYPTEIKTYVNTNGNLNTDFFNGVPILDQNGFPIDKNQPDAWKPVNNTLVVDKGRNTYSASLSFSQILSKKSQFAIFSDLILQKGWLSNPMQRVYFADKDNFYIGNGASIPNYTNASNRDVFQLADDIERLPDNRFKLPIGIRFHQYINDKFVFKTFYRYYFDDWGITAHTFNVELPIKIGNGKYTLYPNYRYYTQTEADYFYPYEKATSNLNYYTSDYDLSKYNANQFGLGFKYYDVFTSKHIGRFGLKNITLNYNYYKRNTGLKAHIVSFGVKFILDK